MLSGAADVSPAALHVIGNIQGYAACQPDQVVGDLGRGVMNPRVDYVQALVFLRVGARPVRAIRMKVVAT